MYLYIQFQLLVYYIFATSTIQFYGDLKKLSWKFHWHQKELFDLCWFNIIKSFFLWIQTNRKFIYDRNVKSYVRGYFHFLCMSPSLYKGQSILGFKEFEGASVLGRLQFNSTLCSSLSPIEEVTSLYLSLYLQSYPCLSHYY